MEEKCDIMRTVLEDKWRQVRDKPEIMRADHPERSERQLGDKCEITQTKFFRSSSVHWETSLKSGRECRVGGKSHAGQGSQSIGIQSVLRRKWETSGDRLEASLKSRAQKIENVVGDNWARRGRQARNHAGQSTHIIQSVLGDK